MEGEEEGRRKGRWESVLDYVVGKEEVWKKVSRIRVENRIDSNNFPVVVWIVGREE